MSTSQTDRKPTMVSTWFSSLRRQPKPKKVIAATKKPLQKSCVDLTSIPTDVKSLPASVTNSPKLKNGFFRDHHFCFSPLKSSAGNGSTESPKSTRTYSTASSRSSGSTNSNDSNQTKTTTTINGKTMTTITRVTKTTVQITKQQSSDNRINRIGTIFDDDGKLISNLDNLDIYKNYANNFRSNIIKNDSTSSCSSAGGGGGGGGIGNSQMIHINNNSIIQQNLYNQSGGGSGESQPKGVRFFSVSDDDSGNSCKKSASNSSIANRPFKSNSLDDDIEFIDTSSSLSDIGASDSIVTDFSEPIMYYNTLPKLPKACATCKTHQQQQKQQQNKSKSEWNISIHKKVLFFAIFFPAECMTVRTQTP